MVVYNCIENLFDFTAQFLNEVVLFSLESAGAWIGGEKLCE